jgi:hypothetical protein
MPWTASDAEKHTHKATTSELQELWAKLPTSAWKRLVMKAAPSARRVRLLQSSRANPTDGLYPVPYGPTKDPAEEGAAGAKSQSSWTCRNARGGRSFLSAALTAK